MKASWRLEVFTTYTKICHSQCEIPAAAIPKPASWQEPEPVQSHHTPLTYLSKFHRYDVLSRPSRSLDLSSDRLVSEIFCPHRVKCVDCGLVSCDFVRFSGRKSMSRIPSEKLINTYKTKWRHNPEDQSLSPTAVFPTKIQYKTTYLTQRSLLDVLF